MAGETSRFDDATLLERLDKLITSGPGAEAIGEATREVMGHTPSELVTTETQSRDVEAEENPEGATWSERLALSFLGKPEDQLAFLQKRHGEDRVFRSGSGALGFYDEAGKAHLVDPLARIGAGDIAGDVADIGGGALKALPGLVVGVLGAKAGMSPSSIAAAQIPADALGAVAAQGIGEALGGTPPTPGERAQDIGANVVAGLLPTAIGFGARGAYRALGPGPVYRRRINKLLLGGDPIEKLKPKIAAGMQLEKEVGGPPLSASELTGTEAGQGFYGTLRRDPLAAQAVKEADLAKAEALRAYKDKTLEAVSRGAGVDTPTAGAAAARAWDAVRKQDAMLLSNASGQAYELLEKAAGGRPIIPIGKLSSLPQQFAHQFAGDPGMKDIIGKAAANIGDLVESGGGSNAVRPQVFNNALSYWREQAANKALSPKERIVAHAMENTLRQSLDEAAAKAGGSGEIAHGLLTVRQFYRHAKQQMADDETEILEKMLDIEKGGDRGDVLTSWFSKRSPREISKTMAVLQRTVPDQAGALRAAAIEELLSKATIKGEMKPGMMASVLGDRRTQSRLLALFEGEPEAAHFIAQLRNSLEYAKRVSKQGTTAGGLPTAPLLGMQSFMKGLPILEGITPWVRNKLMRIPTARQTALMMNDREGRKVLLGLVSPSGTIKGAAARAAAQMAATIAVGDEIYGGEETGEEQTK